MSRVLVLYAGGTVGCSGSPLAPMAGEAFAALLAERGLLGPADAFEALEAPLDSAAMQPADWLTLAARLLARWDAFDAFVVLHGTDTLAWTAAALSLLLAGQDKPVVLTGAQRPLIEAGSDAPRNIADACRVARSALAREVVVCFAGRVLRGNRCSKRSAQDDDAFHSPRWPQLAGLEEGALRPAGAAVWLPAPQEAFEAARCARRVAELAAVAGQVSVAVLTLHPGMPTALLEGLLRVPQARRGCVLCCFGAGNAPDDAAFAAALQALAAAGFSLLAITQAGHGEVRRSQYQSAMALQAAGALDGGALGLEAAQVKLWLGLAGGLAGAELAAWLASDVAGELAVT